MTLERYIEKALKDPEKRIKVFLAYNIGIILVNISMGVGIIILFLYLAGVI